MTIRPLLNSGLALIMGTCLLLVACGKKTKTEDSRSETTTPGQTVTDAYLEKQDVICEGNQACPKNIAKIVIKEKDGEYRLCTGFLLDDDKIVTSTSCIPTDIRREGLSCEKFMFFFFPKAGNRPAEKVGCSEVLQYSHLEGSDPSLWRDDVGILKISSPLPGRRVRDLFVRKGLINNRDYTSWMVDQQSEHHAIIKKVTCTAAHQTYLNPLSVNVSSPNMVFAGCAVTNAGSGAPLMDNSQKIRAIVSKPIQKSLRDFIINTGLLMNGLKEILYASSLACAPILEDNLMMDPVECMKDLTYLKLDNARSNMLSTTLLFGNFKKKLEESVEKLSKYVTFEVKLVANGSGLQEAEITQKCFKPLEDWLPKTNPRNSYLQESISIPVVTFKQGMDEFGRIKGFIIEKPSIKYTMQISLKNLREYKQSTLLYIQSSGLRIETPPISENCSGSLF